MSNALDNIINCHKAGTEDFIMLRIPPDRIKELCPAHISPLADNKGRCTVALLAQVCEQYLFDNVSIGQAFECYLWLLTGISEPGVIISDVDVMLPSMQWLALYSATSNRKAKNDLASFGFHPVSLDKIELDDSGGKICFPDHGYIEWSIPGRGKKLTSAGVLHKLTMPTDGPDAAGHRIAAQVFDPVLEQPGKIRFQTDALAPVFIKGDRLPALVNRMTILEANIEWQKRKQ